MQSKIKQIVPGLFLFVSITILSSNTFSTETFYGEESTLLLTGAKKAADACEAVARQKNLKLSIAIVDDSGQLILFRRMSGSSLASVDIALGKAKTAIKFPAPTRAITEYVHGKNGEPGKSPGLAHMNGFVTLIGGLPIKVDNQLVGGIGISGASGDQDEACAQAGLEALK